MTTDRRNRELAKIHTVARRQLGLDEDTYRAMLESVAGVRSAGGLDAAGRRKVLDHLKRVGGLVGVTDRPHNADVEAVRPLMSKIEALLAEAGRPWAYAEGIARRQCGRERLAWCTPEQLRGVIAALVRDAQRHGRRTQ